MAAINLGESGCSSSADCVGIFFLEGVLSPGDDLNRLAGSRGGEDIKTGMEGDGPGLIERINKAPEEERESRRGSLKMRRRMFINRAVSLSEGAHGKEGRSTHN